MFQDRPDANASPNPGSSLRTRCLTNLGSSVVVALISIPLSLGIAIAAGVPAERGLVTAIIGGIVVGLLNGNGRLISGPSAGPAVMVFDLVQKFGIGSLGIALPLMGLIHLSAGLLKLGRLFRAVSPAVIHAMLAGIGVLILVGQIHVLFDQAAPGGGLENIRAIPHTVTSSLWPLDGSQHQWAAATGGLTLVLLAAMAQTGWKIFRTVPPSLLAVAVATLVASVGHLPINLVDMPDSMRQAIAFPTVADLSLLANGSFLVEVLALAFVASAETLLCSSAVDGMHNGKRTNYDRDLIALGAGNIVCGALGAPPSTGVISRSSANVQAGADSRESSIMAGTWLLIFVLVAPTALEVIPKSCLAGVLIWIGYNLVRKRPYDELLHYGRSEILIFVVTLATIVGVNLLTGILIGLGLAIGKLLFSLGRGFHNFTISVEHDDEHDMTHVYLRGVASFIRLPALAAVLESLPPRREVHLHVEELEYIDHACIDAVTRWEQQRILSRVPVRVEWNYLQHKYHTKNVLDATPEQHAEAPDRSHTLLDFLTPERIFVNPEFASKDDAIRFLSDKILQVDHLDPAHEPLAETALAREAQSSTALGLGLMLPHGILHTTKSLHGAMAISSTGWNFDAPDGKPVRCVVFLATPKESAAHHLAVLAAFARLFSKKPNLAEQLTSAAIPDAAYDILRLEEAAEINYVFEQVT